MIVNEGLLWMIVNKGPKDHTKTFRDLSMPLPLGLILLASDINQKLVTIDPKLKGTILNLLSRAGNHTNTICDLSTPRPLGVILLAIDINWKLVTIDPKLKGTILNLFSRTGNHKNTVCDPLMPLPLGDLVSYWYQSEAHCYWSKIKGDNPPPV